MGTPGNRRQSVSCHNQPKKGRVVCMVSQLLDGRYQIIEVIETGEYGQTYLAKDTRRPGEPKCFVKHLRPTSNDPKLIETARRLFEKEAEVLEKLGQHDQIPQLFAYFEDGQEFFLVESYIAGHSLSSEILPGKPLAEDKVVGILREVLEILVFVHAHGVIHRDIKPGNLIRRTSDHKLVLIDFGAVKEIHVTQGQTPLTVRIGTLEYMPVEQFEYNPQLNSDIYALGMIGIQALTGLPAYDLPKLRDINNSNRGEIVWRHLAVCSQALADILDNMVRYDFRERYQLASEALADLRKITERSRVRTPKLSIYREEVERRASHRGEITVVGRRILDELRSSLELRVEEAEAIEDEVLNPYRKYKEKGEIYEQALQEAMQQEFPFSKETREELKRFQQVLGLTDEDTAKIEDLVIPKSVGFKLYAALRTLVRGTRPSNVGATNNYYPPQTLNQKSNGSSPQTRYNNGHNSSLNGNHKPAPPQRVNRPLNPYLVGTSLAGILLLAGIIYGYLRWQKLQERRSQESQVVNQINALFQESNYETCVKEATAVNSNQFNRHAEIKTFLQQCQAGIRWQNVEVKNFAEHSGAIGSISFSPDGLTLASGSRDRQIKIWDLATGNLIRSFDGDGSAVWSVTYNSDGSRLAAGTSYWRILMWNLKTGELVRTVEHDASVWSVAISKDGKTLASGSGDKTTKLWDIATGRLVYNFPDHSESVYAVALSPDGKIVVSASQDKTMTIVDTESGRLLKTIEGHDGGVRSIAISRDGKFLVSGSYDGMVKIWDLGSGVDSPNYGALIRALKGHSGEVLSVAISPDGKTLATGSKDKTVKIWDVATGELLNNLTGHTDEVYSVAFSPNGRVIASGGKDNQIKLWHR